LRLSERHQRTEFPRPQLHPGRGIAYAHGRGAKVLVAVNSFPPAGQTALWKQAIDNSVRLGADAIIVADIGVAHYAMTKHPDQRLHLSCRGS
jgi:putative protease